MALGPTLPAPSDFPDDDPGPWTDGDRAILKPGKRRVSYVRSERMVVPSYLDGEVLPLEQPTPQQGPKEIVLVFEDAQEREWGVPKDQKEDLVTRL